MLVIYQRRAMWVLRWYTAPFGEYLMVDVDGWRAENRVYVFRVLDISFFLPTSIGSPTSRMVCAPSVIQLGISALSRVAWRGRQHPQLSCKRTADSIMHVMHVTCRKVMCDPPRSACPMRLHITSFSNGGDFIKDGNIAQAHISRPVNLACL